VPFLDTNHQRAALVILLLGAGLAFALAPYATGLIGIPVLYVIFAPLHRWLARRIKPGVSAALVVLLGVFLVLVPGLSFAGVIVTEARQIGGGVIQSPILGRLSELRIGGVDVGTQLAQLGQAVVEWIGSSLFGLLGTATRMALNLTIAFFGLYYLLLSGTRVWDALRPYIPFSTANADKLRARFRNVTVSTLIGTGVTATVQGALVAVGFVIAGLPNAVFWGVVTVVFAILPVLGSAIVWVPGVAALALDTRWGMAGFLALWGAVLVANVDNVIRPIVFNRWAKIHPLLTVVGAFAGVAYFGILGLLIGPLALSYFFELIRMYREEYLAA
jgi:predicted PurR-regulated permease PerM